MIVEVSSRRFAIPLECPCCGAATGSETLIPVTRTPGQRVADEPGLAFPYCARCLAHVAAWDTAGVGSAGVMLLGIVAAVALAIVTQIWIGLVAFVIAIPLAAVLRQSRRSAAKAACGPSCASPGKALAYLGWTGNERGFSFESPTYAARFAEQNHKHLVNVSPQLRMLLEGHRIARLAVPTPAAANLVVPPPATIPDWIARIEKQPGAVARRSELQRALDATPEPAARQQLIAATVRLELAPILARVDATTNTAARKQLLLQTIAEISGDNILEELQTAELRELEARLAR